MKSENILLVDVKGPYSDLFLRIDQLSFILSLDDWEQETLHKLEHSENRTYR